MMIIGICDDKEKERQNIYRLCELFFAAYEQNHDYIIFNSGEEVLAHCEKADKQRIDLLFLDIEMGGISGIELKDRVIREECIWRIVFVSAYQEQMEAAFGLKTLGFLTKPVNVEKLHQKIKMVLEELEQDFILEIPDGDKSNTKFVRLEEIAYLKAEGNYVRIFLHHPENTSFLVSKKLGHFEKEWEHFSIIRVHKSYMVNLASIMEIGKEISLRDMEDKIPVGKLYQKGVREIYREYAREKAKGCI